MLALISWPLSALLIAEPVVPTHQDAIRLCIVQPPEMLYGRPVNGDDARRLAWELSRRSLSDGRLLLTITLVGYSNKAAALEVRKEQCLFIAEVRHHQSADFHGTASMPGAPNLPGPASPTDQLSPMHDSDAITIEIKDLATRKTVLRTSAPPVTHYGRSDKVFTPFPVFARQILAKLDDVPR